MSRNRRLVVGLLLLVGLIVVVSIPNRVMLTERAHVVCGACGLSTAETDRLIEIMRTAEGDRAALLAVYYATFTPGGDPEPCSPSADTIFDAAGR